MTARASWGSGALVTAKPFSSGMGGSCTCILHNDTGPANLPTEQLLSQDWAKAYDRAQMSAHKIR